MKLIELLGLLKHAEYWADGLITTHTCDFRYDAKFKAAYESAQASTGLKEDIQWRTHTVVWVANECLKVKGDFVECGVNKGFLSKALVEYVKFNEQDRDFYLLDTYEGIPLEQFTDEERTKNKPENWIYTDTYELVKESF